MCDRNSTSTTWLDADDVAMHLAEYFTKSRTRFKAQKVDGDSYVIGVVGSAGLGKTETCKEIVKRLQNLGFSAARVPLDGFLLSRTEREDRKVCGYEIGGWRAALAEGALHKLIVARLPITVEIYLPRGEHGEAVTIPSADFILLDGNYAILGSVRRLLAVLVAFVADFETMRVLRFKRDTQPERGRGYQQAEEIWLRELPALKANILAELPEADVLVEVRKDQKRRAVYK